MDGIYFLIRHIPFWAIPIILISMEFAYVYWLKNKKKVYPFFLTVSGLCFLTIIYYYWAGGPEEAVSFLRQLLDTYKI